MLGACAGAGPPGLPSRLPRRRTQRVSGEEGDRRGTGGREERARQGAKVDGARAAVVVCEETEPAERVSEGGGEGQGRVATM